MFQKQTFGTTNTGFGSFNAGASTSSPFSGFKPPASTSGFGAPPAFGANATQQPAAGGGLFGSTNTSGGLFGGTTATSTGFGSSNFGFGAPTTGGLFNNTSSGLFGNNQNTGAFGAKPTTGFGFGASSAPTAPSALFGSSSSTTGLFGPQATAGTGLFGNANGGFGQQATGTAHVKYNPVVGTDVVVKSGTSQNVNIKHHCITCMKEYEGKSLEELRLEDYVAGRKGSSGVFGFQQPENKPLFGGTSTFGQPATTTAPGLFGSTVGSTPAFGQTGAFSFGGGAQTSTQTTGLFGANKPAFGATTNTGASLFTATTTQAPAFGTGTSSFGFGANTQNTSGGLFNSKPATSGFGATPSSGFGGFGTGLFAKTNTTAPSFGTTTPAFGSTGFGTNTTGSGLFGNNTFGKPATTQPSFGFNTQPTLGTGLGTGLGTSFQSKPAGAGFGTLGTAGTLFQQPAQNTFRTDAGLGGGLFANTGLGAPGSAPLNYTTLTGAAPAGCTNVHEQMLALVARPYDTPLFKDLASDTATSAEEVLKPTNPTAVKAVLDSYKLSPDTRLKLTLRPVPHKHHKKSLFDGLEEYDTSLEDKLTLRPSRKRLVLRNRKQEENAGAAQGERSSEDSRHGHDGAETGREIPHEELADGQTHAETNGEAEAAADRHAADRHASWLASPKSSWKENERPTDAEPARRLYPDLVTEEGEGEEEEAPPQPSERRASWLSSLPLRPVPGAKDTESSVRELVRGRHDRDAAESLRFCRHRRGPSGCSRCEKISHQINGQYVSEEENVPPPSSAPHPAGVKLTRAGYYTIPSLEEMTEYLRGDGSCRVPHLTVGRRNYGNVYYDSEIDVAGLDLDALVHFLNKEVIIYPDDEQKPPVGCELNRRAVITLERVWPRDKTLGRPVTEPDRLLKMDYEGKLRRVCDKHDTKFIEYRPQTGSWVFRVEHFSKYGLTDSDEEDDVTPDVLRRQLVDQNLHKSAPPQKQPPPEVGQQPASGVGGATPGPAGPGLAGPEVGLSGPGMGLGGSGLGLAGSGSSPGVTSTDLGKEDYMEQTSLNLLNGTSKAYEMTDMTDMTEDTEQSSLYQDRDYGVRSLTGELARMEHRRSHRLQLMKASLYADTAEALDDASSLSGDQLVPQPAEPLTDASDTADTSRTPLVTHAAQDVQQVSEAPARPLVLHPHTVVLKYHRKVPPFKSTVAGRLGADSLCDLSVSRARLSRWCARPGVMVLTTAAGTLDRLPSVSEFDKLGLYVSGRSEDDWSEQAVVRMAFGRPEGDAALQCLSRQLSSLLSFSDVEEGPECPRLVLRSEPAQRRRLLLRLLQDAEQTRDHKPECGVSGAYRLQVWRLCEALWGLDLEHDGAPGTDERAVVGQHQRLLRWLREAAGEPAPAALDDLDEHGGHSGAVWSLVVSGRVVEACKLAKAGGDLSMAAIMAQSAGDASLKSLLSRQLSSWRACGADRLVSEPRAATLSLLAGIRPRGYLEKCDWISVLLAIATYISPQIPSLRRVIDTYETYLTEDEMSVQHPRPPHLTDCSQAQCRDLRYELLCSRAFDCRPRLGTHTHTPDTLDYSLSFPLGEWLGGASEESISGVAEQLEAAGRWELAVNALLYLRPHRLRGHLVRQVLNRNAPSQFEGPADEERRLLLRTLRIPDKWIKVAQAWRAKYEHKPLLQAQHLVEAEEWAEAQTVLADELLATAVLTDQLAGVSRVLRGLSAAPAEHAVRPAEHAARPAEHAVRALAHYVTLCHEIREVVSANGEGLAALRPSLTAACKALALFEPTSAKMAAAHSEMGARLVQLSLAGGRPAPHLAALLAALKLPPDCAAPAAAKIVTDIAERAADVCLEAEVRS